MPRMTAIIEDTAHQNDNYRNSSNPMANKTSTRVSMASTKERGATPVTATTMALIQLRLPLL
ncbi:hypothetical protein E4U38_001648 [Claviceps purpurea]|nr:hypothetical protein E4U38_001648 [Claviceps purpurea]